MVVGIGIDICENDRISEMLGKYKDRFLKRVFTDDEVAYCLKKKDPTPHFAARFAVKEAFIKALGMPRDLKISYRDVGLKGSEGKKDIHVTGKLAEMLAAKSVTSILFSISHARDYSNACVVLERSQLAPRPTVGSQEAKSLLVADEPSAIRPTAGGEIDDRLADGAS